MGLVVRVPMVSVNEEEVLVVDWHRDEGMRVSRGDVLCSIETSKAVVEVEAEADGYLTHGAKKGEKVKTGALLALISEKPGVNIAGLGKEEEAGAPLEERRWTKKASLLARRMGIDIEAIAARNPGRVIGEADLLTKEMTAPEASARRKPWVERILILGGGSAATQILDLLARVPSQAPVGVLDDDPNLKGRTVMGIRVLGTIGQALDFWNEGICDAMVVALGMDLDKRAELFFTLSEKGVKFTNILDRTVDVHQDVTLGIGNVILSYSYLGPCVRIGDNNFLSSYTGLEHHTEVGSHCLFGPSVSTSGYVSIGSQVMLGTHVGIEPQVRVGDGARIASGSILTADVKPGVIVKARMKF